MEEQQQKKVLNLWTLVLAFNNLTSKGMEVKAIINEWDYVT